MKLKYYIEFAEMIESLDEHDIDGEALGKLSSSLKEIIHDSLKLSGFNILNEEIKIDFDLEE